MMAEFRWIIMSLFLMLLFKFTAAATEKYSLVGDEVTLSCENVTHDQDNCDSATWVFSDGGNTLMLFEHGKIDREAEAKSDRLSVTANCSLVIKKVGHEDVGHFICRQFRSGQLVSESQVHLSVVTMTEFKDSDFVILLCSVWTYGQCPHTVKWLYEGDQNDLETSQHTCSASVTFTSDYNQKLKYSELLKCEVTDGHTEEVHQFTFSPPQSSGEKPGQWKFIVAAVGLAALIIITVAVIRWKRTKGNKTQMDENMVFAVHSSSAAVPRRDAAGQDALHNAAVEVAEDFDVTCQTSSASSADPEADVSYASISYTKNTGRKAKVRLDDDDDKGDAVTYSTVKAPSSSSAGASADPRNLYATINKPTK
ncbi:uncharacterized protein LOC125896872 isoform X7 [Epinephelus fuscoguttatus]|uniref:uncharacterized protein LOC125896872 isoform X7 n=1 Tax=Epinephelus fuscoguttatus TaxID=293821 RepID=UPI0020D0C5AF|nr:uncharacterized protein LOC125896872 isoform X7 [Epinephelus fuscoguttatus]